MLAMKLRNFLDGLTYRSAVFARDGLLCSYCSKPLLISEATLDHVEPLARGGRNHPSNMVVACNTCNNRKGCLTLTEYLLGEMTSLPIGEPKTSMSSCRQGGTFEITNEADRSTARKRKQMSWRDPEMHRRTLELKAMYVRIKEGHKGPRFHKPLFLPTLSSKLGELPAFRKLMDSEIEPRRLAV